MNLKERKKRACLLPTCKGERFDLVHKFPMDKERAELWRKALDIADLYNYSLDQLRKRVFICSRHFRIQDYKNIESRCLNKTALPSINLKILDNLDIIDRCHMQNNKSTELIDMQAEKSNKFALDNKLNESIYLNDILKNDSTKIDYDKYSKNNLNLSNFSEPQQINVCMEDKNIEPLLKIVKYVPTNITNSQNLIALLSITNENLPNLDHQIVYKLEPQIAIEQRENRLYEIQESVEKDNNPCIEIKYKNDMTLTCDSIEINHKNYLQPLVFNFFWLRDHCRCENCYNSETFQRKINILDIPADIKPALCKLIDNDLIIKWQDNHETTFSLEFLHNCQYDVVKQTIENQKPILWNKGTIEGQNYARINLNDYLCDDEQAKNIIRSLVTYGVAFIEKVPANPQSTEITIKRLFNIQKTLFGEMWTFSDNKDHGDTAYTKDYLGAHTDNTYFNDAAGLQVLHCIQHNGTGGESLLVDGFKALEKIKEQHPKTFENLCKIPITSEYKEEGCNHTYCAPLIKLNAITGIVEQIRYNLYDRAPMASIPQTEMKQFYTDLRLLANEIQSPENEWWFKLVPGTVMIFDNWRLLHGRAQYTGKRVMSGCYVSRTEYLSVARTMGIIS